MNISGLKLINDIVAKKHDGDTRLGNPSADQAHYDRRMTAMSRMTGGKGFRTPPKAARIFSDGKTRGDRKRALRAATNAKIGEMKVAV